jgi:hypothetical protein
MREAEQVAAILYRPKRHHGRAMHRALREAAMRRLVPKIVQFLLELPSLHAEYMDNMMLELMAGHPLPPPTARTYVAETLLPEKKR